MWFRGVVAYKGLYFDLAVASAVAFKGYPDVILAVDSDVVDHCQSVGIPEFLQRLPSPKFL